jgi:4-hydroxy-3-methylbut-2-en-1-yl diphosphate reductase
VTTRGGPNPLRYDGCVPSKVILAAPRGYCAGVDRAVDVVERALRLYGEPVYVRKQIVHNIHVVRDLERKGAVFVEEETEVPEGATVVLSAHGVAPEVYVNSESRSLRVIDATCPLVTKVHLEARRFARDGSTILLIGHQGHEEVIGTSGEAPDHIRLVGDVEEARTVDVPDPSKVSYLSQTTLAVDETNRVIEVLRERFPEIQAPPRDDICYATQNRQDAVKEVARQADVVLVIGSDNSSNSNRLVEVSRALGTPAHLIDDQTEIDPGWLEGAEVVGVTSGASAPEWLVERVVEKLRTLGAGEVEELAVTEEHMAFGLPRGVRESDETRLRAGAAG